MSGHERLHAHDELAAPTRVTPSIDTPAPIGVVPLPAAAGVIDRAPASECQHQTPLLRRLSTPADAPVIRRYTSTSTYTLGPAAVGTAMFETQGLAIGEEGAADLTTGYRRTQTRTTATGLEDQAQEWSATNRRWDDAGAAVARTDQPSIKVSANSLFAVQEDGGQSRVLYLTAAQLTAVNISLAAHTAPVHVRLVAAGPSITVNGQVLVQVRPELVTRIGGNPATWANSECNEVASAVLGRQVNRDSMSTAAAVRGARPTDDASAPAVGQAYGFRAKNSKATDKQLNKSLPGRRKRDAKIEEMLGQVRSKFNDAMTGFADDLSGIGLKARQLLPGWNEHFEAVIAADGADRIMLINYNRDIEKKQELRRLVTHLFLDPAFKKAFLDWVEVKAQATPTAKWRDFYGWMATFINTAPEGRVAMDAVQAGLSADVRAFMGTPPKEMLYFDIYGTAAPDQNFTAKFGPSARGNNHETWVL